MSHLPRTRGDASRPSHPTARGPASAAHAGGCVSRGDLESLLESICRARGGMRIVCRGLGGTVGHLPRTRGDAMRLKKRARSAAASAAHAGGCVATFQAYRRRRRICRARGGMRVAELIENGALSHLPRTRGDAESSYSGCASSAASAAHAGGCAWATQTRTRTRRICRARGGMRAAGAKMVDAIRHLPRTRGDAFQRDRRIELARASAAHAGGCVFLAIFHLLWSGICRARGGMRLLAQMAVINQQHLPRTRGDARLTGCQSPARPASAAHAGGCVEIAAQSDSRLGICRARGGMRIQLGLICRREWHLPRTRGDAHVRSNRPRRLKASAAHAGGCVPLSI